ncbi:toll/interleukin-1 receptor domain-containing protein [Nitrospira sp. T9]|uniref:toll/interleukin-1 receptor domain-containing protein n=1 Tax=unclassified Nitrospira TaxID=2652172 RepID=UPI003F97B646
MADVFISYSKADRPLAMKLSAFLEAQGYSTWWDDNLEVAATFRDTIMQELGEARAVIVIWTEVSVDSDWVRAEAGRARQQKKLIPVKTKDLIHNNIPLPFGEMHIGDVADETAILQAIETELTKPQISRSAFSVVYKMARHEWLLWFGTIGGALTLAANLGNLITLSKTVRLIFSNWVWLLQYLWDALLFFQFKISAYDAVLMTIFVMVTANVFRSCRSQVTMKTVGSAFRKVSLSLALVVIAVILIMSVVGVSIKVNKSNQLNSYIENQFPNDLDCSRAVNEFVRYLYREQYDVDLRKARPPVEFEQSLPGKLEGVRCIEKFSVDREELMHVAWQILDLENDVEEKRSLVLPLIAANPRSGPLLAWMRSTLILLPLALPFFIYGIARLFSLLRLETGILSVRLWRIIAGTALIIAFNHLTLWVEQRPWVVDILARLREI